MVELRYHLKDLMKRGGKAACGLRGELIIHTIRYGADFS